MSRKTMRQAASRIAEHAARHQLRRVEVVLHGGEPLLAGMEAIEYCATTLRAEIGCDTETPIQLQTNGVRLSSEYLRMLQRHEIRVGVSIDGDLVAHDRHRRRVGGPPPNDVRWIAVHD
jgi:uncharacterized protein